MTIAIRTLRPSRTLYLMRLRDVVSAYAWGALVGIAATLLCQQVFS